MAAVTAQAMAGEIDFTESPTGAWHFEGLPESVLDARQQIRLTPGARTFLSNLESSRVSDRLSPEGSARSFHHWPTSPVSNRANMLKWKAATSRAVVGDIVDRPGKRAALRNLRSARYSAASNHRHRRRRE